MKFDSYTRFLKSPLYQECILAEVEGRPLPDAQQVPSSPVSKHSASSGHSNTSTPKKVPTRAPAFPRRALCRQQTSLLASSLTRRARKTCTPGALGGAGASCWSGGVGGLHLPRRPRLGVPPHFPSRVSPATLQQRHAVLIALSL